MPYVVTAPTGGASSLVKGYSERTRAAEAKRDEYHIVLGQDIPNMVLGATSPYADGNGVVWLYNWGVYLNLALPSMDGTGGIDGTSASWVNCGGIWDGPTPPDGTAISGSPDPIFAGGFSVVLGITLPELLPNIDILTSGQYIPTTTRAAPDNGLMGLMTPSNTVMFGFYSQPVSTYFTYGVESAIFTIGLIDDGVAESFTGTLRQPFMSIWSAAPQNINADTTDFTLNSPLNGVLDSNVLR